MFIYIAWNTILVSFRVFVLVFLHLSARHIFYAKWNYARSVITFFANEGQLLHAFPVIMLHGTIELSSIVIAAAAGFTMGIAFFSRQYPRFASFKMGTLKGLKL